MKDYKVLVNNNARVIKDLAWAKEVAKRDSLVNFRAVVLEDGGRLYFLGQRGGHRSEGESFGAVARQQRAHTVVVLNSLDETRLGKRSSLATALHGVGKLHH